MNKENELLCPNCQTGLDSLNLDSRTPICPYMDFHNGTYCGKYKKIKEQPQETE